MVEEVSLPLLFQRAQSVYSRYNSGQLDRTELNEGVSLLKQCQERIDKLGIFSRNELKEDVSTINLKYLLVEYYLGDLTDKLPANDRLEVLGEANAHLKAFVGLCESLELVPEAELQALAREAPVDAARRRAEKIARFKRQRDAESKLLAIKERKERRRRSKHAAAKSSAAEEDDDDEDEEEGDDDEEEREAWFMQICSSLCKAMDLLEGLQKEEEMLGEVNKLNENGKEAFSQTIMEQRNAKEEAMRKAVTSSSSSRRSASSITCATYAQDVIEGRASPSQAPHHHHHQQVLFGPASMVTGSLTTERETIAAQVFQPSHRLPSMSIEEAGMKEMEIMKTWNESNAKLIEESKSTWLNDDDLKNDDDDDEDGDVAKSRAWDDWKDDHPRGSGNKKLTPCG